MWSFYCSNISGTWGGLLEHIWKKGYIQVMLKQKLPSYLFTSFSQQRIPWSREWGWQCLIYFLSPPLSQPPPTTHSGEYLLHSWSCQTYALHKQKHFNCLSLSLLACSYVVSTWLLLPLGDTPVGFHWHRGQEGNVFISNLVRLIKIRSESNCHWEGKD